MYPTDGMTAEELDFVDQYANAVNGIPDSFDMFEPYTITGLSGAETLDVDQIRDFVRMLTDWHNALDTLAADLSGPDDRYSASGGQFLHYETEMRERLAIKFYRAVVAFVAGRVDPTAHVEGAYCYSAGFVPHLSDLTTTSA